ncbi:hypothetical protein [Brevundimonas sp.]|uniref:hypothetical protein n=1 Tax=Brevundimonas sp. TaxID=1871086 RepID=UPI0027F0F5EE|nr:hypothetical protein [Brevundimonas sp.]MDQ7812542.1 hypothetical protein [Brevundimonas sp.]
MKRFVMLAALFAAACQPMPVEGGQADLAQTAPATQTAATQTPADEAAACAARGGKMLPQGRMQTLQCLVSYSDAGQRCTDGDDCQGGCRIEDVANAPRAGAAVVGQCQATSSPFGCYTPVENGKAEAAICVD